MARSVESLRERPRPIILEFKRFEYEVMKKENGTKYYPDGLIDTWTQVDPVSRLKAHLMSTDVLTDAIEDDLRSAIKSQIENGLKTAAAEPSIVADTGEELDDRFAPGTPQGMHHAPDGKDGTSLH